MAMVLAMIKSLEIKVYGIKFSQWNVHNINKHQYICTRFEFETFQRRTTVTNLTVPTPPPKKNLHYL